jgi:NADPH:quinone reductase-like Zn-dependent oxidoreductase
MKLQYSVLIVLIVYAAWHLLKLARDAHRVGRRGGTVCQVGFLGGGGALALEPVFQIPSGVFLSVFGSALVTGTADFPLSEIPFQAIVDRVAAGAYQARPARVFGFEQIRQAHALMESGQAGGKIVVRV